MQMQQEDQSSFTKAPCMKFANSVHKRVEIVGLVFTSRFVKGKPNHCRVVTYGTCIT